jgi:two-component system NtrC family sensor kinase
MNNAGSASLPKASSMADTVYTPADSPRPDQLQATNARTFIGQWMINGVALLAIGIIIASNLHGERQHLETITEGRLSLSAKSIADQVERRLVSINIALNTLRTNLPYLRDQKQGETLIAMNLKAFQSTVDGVRTVGIIDTRGVATASNRAELVGHDFSAREFFQSVQKDPDARTLHVSEPFLTQLGAYSLNVSQTSFDAQGKLSEIVSATLDPDELKPILTSLRYTPDVAVGLIHGSGKALIYISTPEIAPGTDVSDPESFFSRHLKGGKPDSILSGVAPVLPNERLAAVHTINPAGLSMSSPLVVVVSQERASYLGSWLIDVRTQASLFALFATLACLSLYFYQRRERNLARLLFEHQAARQNDVDRLQLATEASNTGIWELDLKSRTLIWDDTMLRLYGKERADFSSAYAAWQECIVPDDLAATDNALLQAIEQGQAFDAHFRIRRGDGEIRIIDAHAWPYFDSAGQPKRMIGVNRDITVRELAERAVIESEERFSAFFEHARVGMARTSPEKGWIQANPALCAILGYPVQELLQKTWLELTHPQDIAADVAYFERLLSGEIDHYSMEKRFIRKEGRIVHTFMAISAVRRSDRSIAFVAAIIEDISERQRVAEAALGAQRLTQQFLDHLPGTAYVKDESLRLVMANQAFQKLLGMDPEAIIGKCNNELFPSHFARKLDDDDRQVLDSGQSTAIEEDFEGRYFETCKFVIEGEAGKRLLGGITMDVTQRQKSFARQQALLKISELGDSLPETEFFARGLEMVEQLTGSQIGFLYIANDDRIELVASTAGAKKDYSALHARPDPMSGAGLWADCARSRKIELFNDYRGNGPGLPQGPAPLRRLVTVPVVEGDRVRLIVVVGNKAVDYEEFDCASVQLIGNDLWRIARRARAESALQQKLAELTVLNARLDETNNKLLQSEKLASIGQLAAGVAHEINNPIGFVSSNLNSLAGYVKDLLAIDAAYQDIEEGHGGALPNAFERVRQIKSDADYDFMISDIHHLLDESREGLGRVRKIVQDLKDFSHVGDTGWQRVDLHEGLESTLNIVWNEIKYKAEVDRDYADLPQIFCIPSQINQVFMNLLVNAAQAIAAHGHIVLRSGHDELTAWFEVQDDGAGIAPENIKNIFEPFFTTKAVGQGTGLGLSLSWAIIQRHQGRIEVRPAPGQGTIFRITLPIDGKPDAANATEDTP